jgi:hypothetical protein
MAWIERSVAFTKLRQLLIKGRFSFDFDGIPLTAKKLSLPKRLNLLKVGIDTIIRSNKMHSLPPVIQVEPTNICNLKCPLCPTGWNSSKRQKGLSKENGVF